MFGFDVCHSSFLYVLLYAKCAGSMTNLIDDRIPGNAQEYKVKVIFAIFTGQNQFPGHGAK